MKINKLLYIVFLVPLFLNNTCEKTNDITDGCFKVKMHGYLCGQAVFEILDKSYQHLGEDGWKDAEGNTLNNVFYSMLTCTDLKVLDAMARPSYKGLEFKVKVITNDEDGSCAICKALLYGPKTTHRVKFFNECD